ncbi:hypothetical protein TNCV_5027671 [Trichonephila clavipes]|nr:hypothetical protein TNCV_5027671 [Trichonephila clavipes]
MPSVGCSLEHHAGKHYNLDRSTPILRKNTLEMARNLPPLFPSTNLTRGLAAGRQLRVHPCHKGTIYLQTPMPFSGFKRRAHGSADNA